MVCELHLIKLLTNRQEIVCTKILQRQVAEHMRGEDYGVGTGKLQERGRCRVRWRSSQESPLWGPVGQVIDLRLYLKTNTGKTFL